MPNTHRIKIKLGDAEFEAEGPSETVQSQYEQFLKAAALMGQKAATATAKSKTIEEEKPPAGDIDEGVVGRIFEVRTDGNVALKVLPKGEEREGDAFLLILYGFRRLRGQEAILGTQLLRSGQLSGIGTIRPSRALASYDRYVIRGGNRKGSTYSLNNQGVTKAEEIAARIFE
jgi:hypothetical protein